MIQFLVARPLLGDPHGECSSSTWGKRKSCPWSYLWRQAWPIGMSEQKKAWPGQGSSKEGGRCRFPLGAPALSTRSSRPRRAADDQSLLHRNPLYRVWDIRELNEPWQKNLGLDYECALDGHFILLWLNFDTEEITHFYLFIGLDLLQNLLTFPQRLFFSHKRISFNAYLLKHLGRIGVCGFKAPSYFL